MSKPEDIPQRIWDEASAEALKYVEWIDPPPVDGVASAEHVLAVSFARAIIAAEQRERERIIAALDDEAEITPCREDAMVVQTCADLVRADFSYDGVEQIQTEREALANRGTEND